jgi:hypothetical protein
MQMDVEDVSSAVGPRTVRGLGRLLAGGHSHSVQCVHIVQCVEATAPTCDLSVHMRQALPPALGCA